MTLYLLRHGLAEPPVQDDRIRCLTQEGVRRIKRQAEAFVRAGIRPDRLFCSPYPRARQTADLVAAVLGIHAEEDRRLAPGAMVEGMLELIRETGNPARVMIVGHQPDLGYMVQALTGNTVVVREGSLIAIDASVLRPHRCSLAGLYDPDVMVALSNTMD